ncbi:MAG: transcriptional regulator [Planctomycetota bacterium]
MNDQDFHARLSSLLTKINELPEGERDRLQELADQTKSRHDRVKKAIGEMQESLDYLRLSVKYLVFDLEATRRENRYLRSMLARSAGDEAQD